VAELNLSVDLSSEIPLYVQVKNQVRLAIDRGLLKPGTQMPTVRDLALTLQINANTVARIYADLEREGYLSRRRGVGTFAVDPHEGESVEPQGKRELRETLRQLRNLGYSDRQVLELAAELLEEFE
jgi:GntR family transcriptional regulator